MQDSFGMLAAVDPTGPFAAVCGITWTLLCLTSGVAALVSAALCPFRRTVRQGLRLSRVGLWAGLIAFVVAIVATIATAGFSKNSPEPVGDASLLILLTGIPPGLAFFTGRLCRWKIATLEAGELADTALRPKAAPLSAWRIWENRRRLSALMLVVSTAVIGFAFLWTEPTPLPISLHPLQPDEPAPWGVWRRNSSQGTTFVITNRSTKTIVATISAIEVKVGSNWVVQSRPDRMLAFAGTNAIRIPGATHAFSPGDITYHLAPHQASYSTIQWRDSQMAGMGIGMNYLSGRPTGSVWRLSLSVHEKLTGWDDVVARLKQIKRSRRLVALGITNSPSFFSTNVSYFGKPITVLSEEVTSRLDDE